MQRKVFILTFGIYCLMYSALLQAQSLYNKSEAKVMFYNAENLFDVRDDSLTTDEEFLPQGMRHWTYFKLNQKLSRLYKTIMAIGEWKPPAIIGLCEIENRYVLQRLVEDTPL